MGGKPPKPPWLRDAARHYAFRQAEPTTNTAWRVVVSMGDESCQGFEEIITSSRTHGLDQLWLG